MVSSTKNGLANKGMYQSFVNVWGETTSSNTGRISLRENTSCFLLQRFSDSARFALFCINVSSTGVPKIVQFYSSGYSDNGSFYYDSSYIYYIKMYGGFDSCIPLGNTTPLTLERITEMPSDVTSLTIHTI